jgi:transcription elongation factor GreB
MSKAFTKEDEGVPEPPLVPRRSPLPDGVQNYVTARGLELLRAERAQLDAERALIDVNRDDRARSLAVAAWLQRGLELDQRIASAVRVDPPVAASVVRFGSKVTVENEAGQAQRYEIVGVDEAEPAAGRIAFLSPLARTLLGASVGDEVSLVTPGGRQLLEVIAIE